LPSLHPRWQRVSKVEAEQFGAEVESGWIMQKYGGRGLILEEKGVLWSKRPIKGEKPLGQRLIEG